MTGIRTRRKTRRMDEILDAAQELIVENGSGGMAVEALADAAEVSVVTIYNYFGSKDGVIHRLGIRHHERALSLREPLLSDPPADPIAALESYMDLTFRHAFDVLDRAAWRHILAVDFSVPGASPRLDIDEVVHGQVDGMLDRIAAKDGLPGGAVRRDLADLAHAVMDYHFYRLVRDDRAAPASAARLARRQFCVAAQAVLAGTPNRKGEGAR